MLADVENVWQLPRGGTLEQQLFTIEETRAITRLGRSLLYEKLRNGELRSVTIGRSRRIPKAAIQDFISKLERDQAYEA